MKYAVRIAGNRTLVSDLALLKDMPLVDLYCDFKPERDGELLRSIKTLKQLSGRPAAELLREAGKPAPDKP